MWPQQMKNTKNIQKYQLKHFNGDGISEQWVVPVHDVGIFTLQEFPFFTLTSFPPGFLVHVGGVVSARSVKLLDRIHNPGELSA